MTSPVLILLVTASIICTTTFLEVQCQVTSPGKCAVFDSKNKFSLSQFFTGTWYAVEGYTNRYHDDTVCQEFSWRIDGKYVYINETVYNPSKGKHQTISGLGRFSRKGNMNHLIMVPGLKSLPMGSHLWIVATDYNNYALVYICDELKGQQIPMKREFMYILSRVPTLRPSIRARVIIDNIVRGGFPVAPLAPFNQLDCPAITKPQIIRPKYAKAYKKA